MQENAPWENPIPSLPRYGCEVVASLAGGRRPLTLSALCGAFLKKALVQNDRRGYIGAEKVLPVLV